MRDPRSGEADAERFLDARGRGRVDPGLLALHCEVDAFFWPEPAWWTNRLFRPGEPRSQLL